MSHQSAISLLSSFNLTYNFYMVIFQHEVSHSSVISGDVKRSIIQVLVKNGWERKLRNWIYKRLQTYHPPPHPAATAEHIKEANSYVRRAQVLSSCQNLT